MQIYHILKKWFLPASCVYNNFWPIVLNTNNFWPTALTCHGFNEWVLTTIAWFHLFWNAFQLLDNLFKWSLSLYLILWVLTLSVFLKTHQYIHKPNNGKVSVYPAYLCRAIRNWNPDCNIFVNTTCFFLFVALLQRLIQGWFFDCLYF